jgi:hypothetical protein
MNKTIKKIIKKIIPGSPNLKYLGNYMEWYNSENNWLTILARDDKLNHYLLKK